MAVTYAGDVNFDPNNVPLQIGDTGVGSLVVNGGSTELFDGPANGNGPFVQIGNQAGSSGSVLVTGAGSTLRFIGDGFYDTGMHVGAAGTGSLTVSSGGSLEMFTDPVNSPDEAGFTVGRFGGGMGTFTLDDATATLAADFGYLQVGRDGATGVVDITNGAQLMMFGAELASMQIGNAGNGTFDISGGSVVTILSGDGTPPAVATFPGTFFNLGRNGGTGTATIDGSTLDLRSEFEAGAGIGRSGAGGSGTMNLVNGALLTIEAESVDTFINVGRDQSDGTLNVTDSAVTMTSTGTGTASVFNLARDATEGTATFDNSTLTMSSAESFTMMRIGREAGADGTLIFQNGSTASLTGDTAELTVGHTANVTADFQVLSGSQVTIDNTNAVLGDSGFTVGRFANSTATALIDGVGSSVNGMDLTLVGGNTLMGQAAGNGTLTMRNEASLTTGDMLVGGGGELIAGDATINLDPSNAAFGGFLGFDDGEVRLLNSGPLYVNGNINADGSSFTFDVRSNGSIAGSIVQNGDIFSNDMENQLLVRPLGGYTFAAGDGYTLFESNATTFEDILFDRTLPLTPVNDGTLQVSGQAAGFAYMFVETQDAVSSLDFVALNNGDGTGQRKLDFSPGNPEPVTFVYDSTIGAGSGLVGTTDSLIAFNIDRILGGAADDTITVSGSDNFILFGRDGDDTLAGGAGNDLFVGGAGADSLNGGAGKDVASYADSSLGLQVDLQNAAVNTGIAAGDTYASIEVVIGSGGNDNIRGDAGANQLEGRNGNDFINGRAGDDDLRGGNGNDVIVGGTGADAHIGGAGTDTASYSDSGTGITVDLQSNGLNTGIAAGDGYNSIENLVATNFNDDARGDNTANRIEARDGNDFLFGRGGDDTMLGGDGNDNLRGGSGGDILNGGNGSDSANYIDSVGVRADLQNAAVNTGVAAGDSYISIENLLGSNGGDDLRGDGGANRLIGRNGDDFLTGRNGNDELFGGNGNDNLRGGSGNDTLTGNAGDDVFRFDAPSEGIDVIRDFQINRDTIVLNDSGFTSLSTGVLSADNFRLTGTAGDADDYIVYDAASGALFYDADGAGGTGPVRFATLQNTAAIDHQDFLII